MVIKFYVRNLLIFSLLFLLVVANNQSVAQDYYDYNWYFGNSVKGIIFNKFNDEPLVVSDQAVPFGTGGSAVATDANTGQLLFYTDGLNIYDPSHSIMSNGNGILGNNAINQPAAICPVPNDQGKYYVFSNNGGANGVTFSIVDVNLPGNAAANQPNLGAVNAPKNNPVITNTAEAMIIVRGNVMDQFWLILQNTASNPNVINVYDISSFTSSTAPPPTSTLNLPNDYEAANFAYSGAVNKIAVAPKDDNKNIALIDFAPATGALTFDTEILNSLVIDGGTEAIYDTEWSPDGSKLYISRHGNLPSPGATGNLYQYDLNNPGNTLTTQIGGPVYRSFGLKIGPDNRIYHLFQTSQFDPGVSIGRINFPDSTAQAVTGIGYEIPILSSPQFNSRQFPEFSFPEEKMLNPIDFEVFGTCSTIPTMFYPQFDDDPQPTNFTWNFGIPNTGAENYIAPIITYSAGGSYDVRLTIDAGTETEVYNETVVITDNMLTVDLGQDTTVCRGQDYDFEVMVQGGSGSLTYAWSDGTTGQTKTLTNIGGATSPADSAGTYWIVVTDAATGCIAYDAIEISIYMDEQQKTNVWYFGNNAGIDFNQSPSVALSDGAQTAPEGVATISDANGELIFYTDGETVYNKLHNVMSNGTGIGGDPGSTQSSVIAAFPGDETQYYIFTTDENFGDGTYNLRYSVVDLKLDPPYGEVTAKGKPLFTNSTEKLTGTAPGGNAWILAHEFGNNTFRAYAIDTMGIRQPVLSAIGSVHNSAAPENGSGYMKLSNESKLAVTVPGGPNIIEIFDFDQGTGEVSNLLSLDLMEPGGSVYGIEFSDGSNKLYVTINGGGSSIFKEYAFDSLRTQITEVQSQTVSASLGAIQRAPDGNIYVAVDGSSSLATISPNETDTIMSAFVLDGFMLAGGTTSTLGLPNFIQIIPPPAQSPAIMAGTGCVNQQITFSGTGRSVIDQFEWDFGDGSPRSTDMQAMHAYTAPGMYDVTLTLSNPCDVVLVLFQTIEVFDTPTTLGTRAEGFCPINDVSLNISATDPDPTGLTVYSWTDIQGNPLGTNNILAVTAPGQYIATTTNQNGCSETDTIQVVDVSPVVDLGLDQTICQNDVVPDLNALNPSGTKTWFINGVQQTETGSTIVVDSSLPGIFTYIVDLIDNLNGCPARDTIVFTINPQPDLVTTPSPSTCNNMTGSLSLDLQNFDPAVNYTYTVSGPSNATGQFTVNPFVVNGLGAGNYTIDVSNDLTGCVGTNTNISIQDQLAFNITSIGPSNTTQDFCDGNGSIQVDLDLVAVYPVTWRVLDGTGADITATLPGAGGPSPDEGGFFTITGLSEGDFTIEVIDFNGCIQSDVFSIMSTPVVFTIDGNPDYCFDPNDPAATAPQLTLRDGGGVRLNDTSNDYDIVWSSATGHFTDPGTQNPTTSTVGIDGIGTHVYEVTVTPLIVTGNECATTQSITVTIQEPPVVSIAVIGEVCDGQVQLTVNVDNALPGEVFTFAWTITQYPDVQTINVSYQDGTGIRSHQIVVGSNLRQCTGRTTLDLEVFEPINIQFDPIQACDDGQPVPITAVITPAGVSTIWTFNGATIATDQLTIDALNEGQYTLTASTASCQTESVVVLTRDPFTDANLPATAIICPADPDPALNMVELDPGGDFVDFEWVFNGVTTTTPTFMADSEGVLEARLTNPFGCVDVVTVEIVEDCIPRLSVPNAFRPNSTITGNEAWKVFSNFVTKLDVFIYNRWGELVYHSDKLDFTWDGTIDGKPAPVGTYAYLITYESDFDRTDRVYEQRGGVALIR